MVAKIMKGSHKRLNRDKTWWPNFWEKRFKKYLDSGQIPKNGKVLDFASVNYCNSNPFKMDMVIYDHPAEGEFDWHLPYKDNEFDAIVFHSSINKDPRIKQGQYPQLPPKKSFSIIGSGWMIKEFVIGRWSELYRISKNNAVWFITCFKHVEHNNEVEKILTDKDRHNKKIIVEGW